MVSPRAKTPPTKFIAQESDTIIIVMGQAGAGKSSFINDAIGKRVASTSGNTNGSHTKTIEPFPISRSSPRIVLVDTPGFNDTHAQDIETLQLLVDWLASQSRTIPTSIIYVYEITQARTLPKGEYMHPTKFFGFGTAKNIILATVKWNELAKIATGEHREREINRMWGENYDSGTRIVRFEDNQGSASAIVTMARSNAATVDSVQKDLARIFGVLAKPVRKEGGIGKLLRRLFKLVRAPRPSET